MAPHRRRPSPTRINWLIVSIFAIVIIGLFFLLSSFGPRPAGTNSNERISDQTSLAILERSEELERDFDSRIIEGIVDGEDMDVLQRSIDLQKEFIASLPARDFSAEGRLERLESKFSEYQGEILAGEAERVEAEAKAVEAIDSGRALVLYRRALGIREQLRENHGTSSFNDFARLSRLQRLVQQMDVQPLYERSVELEREGDEFEEQGELVLAVEKFADAAEIQEQINRLYPGLSLAKPLRANRLREKEAEVLSGKLKREIDDLIDEGDDLIFEGSYDEASTVFARARELQRSLTLEFPKSPYASRSREESLRIRKDNAAGFQAYQRMKRLEADLNEALNDGDYGESERIIGELQGQLDQFQLRFSLSTLPIEPLVLRVAYLNRKKRDLRRISSAIETDLLPIPGESGSLMYASEVPQFLYELVSETNPSRNVGGDLPVESVSLPEIELFLKRASWVTAKTVRLPTLNEFLLVAEKSAEMEALTVLSSEAGESNTRRVQANDPDEDGFYHLLGNVSEMVVSTVPGESIVEIGGNLRMMETQIRELEPVPLDRGERNRMVGFRFVVDEEGFPLSLVEDPRI
ncbi:MAG: hypothetical protein AAGJ81_11370 [Verrucomicrobiota bacterium]